MKRGAYLSLASRYHLKALIFIRDYYSIYSNNGTNPIYVKTKLQVLKFNNKMELHNHIFRVRENIRRFMNES